MTPLQPRTDPEAIGAKGPPPVDAWFFAKALAGYAFDPEDRRVSLPNRPLIRLMAEAPGAGSKQIWDDHLATLSEPEAGAWIEAVAAVNPDDPPPDADGWGPPLSFSLPPVDPFSIDVLPEPVAR